MGEHVTLYLADLPVPAPRPTQANIVKQVKSLSLKISYADHTSFCFYKAKCRQNVGQKITGSVIAETKCTTEHFSLSLNKVTHPLIQIYIVYIQNKTLVILSHITLCNKI